MNNSMSFCSNPEPSEQLEQIIKLKVQLTKHKSKIEGYKQIEHNYKRLTIKSEAIEKQLTHYHKIMQTFFQKLKKLMNLLDIDHLAIFGTDHQHTLDLHHPQHQDPKPLHQSTQKITDSISFINLNSPPSSPQHNLSLSNPSLLRRINKLNSLKSISREQIGIEFTHEDAKFQLIESAIKSLLRSNQEYKLTLSQYEQSSMNIETNAKEQELIVKRLEAQVRMKEKQIEERDQEIGELLRKIEEMRELSREKQEVIAKQQKQQEVIVRTYEELEGKILQLKNQSSHEQQKKQRCRNNCLELIEQLKPSDDAYLKAYLVSSNLLKHPKAQNSPLVYSFNIASIDKRPDAYSESGRYSQKHRTSFIPKNKHQFVFD